MLKYLNGNVILLKRAAPDAVILTIRCAASDDNVDKMTIFLFISLRKYRVLYLFMWEIISKFGTK